ncbi:MAG: DUF6364 family protein [Armatimonadota bacterium]
MQTKLTLRIEDRLVRRAKTYARRAGKSVSGIVADFFAQLTEPSDPPQAPLSPAVRSLIGALEGKKVSEEVYRRHLVEKHR